MARATAEQEAIFRAQLAEVKRQFEDGAWRVNFAAGFSVDNLIAKMAGAPQLPKTYEQKLLVEAAAEIEKTEKVLLPWALEGKRSNGTTYDRAYYTLSIRDIANRIKDATGAAWNESIFAAIANIPHDTAVSVKQAAEDVKNAVAPYLPEAETVSEFVFWLKVGVGVTVGVVVLGAIGYAARGLK